MSRRQSKRVQSKRRREELQQQRFVATDYSSLNVQQLKAKLKERGCVSSGRKAELVCRLDLNDREIHAKKTKQKDEPARGSDGEEPLCDAGHVNCANECDSCSKALCEQCHLIVCPDCGDWQGCQHCLEYHTDTHF